MTTKAIAANALGKQESKYLALIKSHLAEIKGIQENTARKRADGRKVKARIDRNLRQIQATIDCVEAAL